MAFRFAIGLTFRLDTRVYVITEAIASGGYKARDLVSDHVITISQNAFLKGLYQGNIEVVKTEEYEAGGFNEADINLIPKELTAIARKRLAYVNAVMTVSNTKEDFEPIIKAVARKEGFSDPPSWITVYRWKRAYIQSNDIRSLIPDFSARGRFPKLNPIVREIADQVIRQKYLVPERISVTETWRIICARIDQYNLKRKEDILAGKVIGLTYPAKSTIFDIINGMDQYEVTRAREGKRTADYRYAALGQGLKSSRVLEYVLYDHTKTDLFVVSDEGLPIGRCWITIAIDLCSRCIHGYYLSFTPPSYLSIMQCLRHGIMPKTYIKDKYPEVENEWNVFGIPETIIVDNGKEFLSNNLRDACSQLGITVLYSPIAEPWFKPQVERFFRTLNQRLLHNIPGTTFSNVLEKGDYNPKESAVITISDLHKLLHIFFVDMYHMDKHRGLGTTPAKAWEQNVSQFPVTLPDSPRELDVLLGYTEERIVSRSGIELYGLFYNSEELGLFRRTLPPGTKVKVKFDPTDLSSVWVYDATNHKTIHVPAIDQHYTKDLSVWQHKVVRNYAQREFGKVDKEALGRARMRIEAIVEEAVRTVKKTSGGVRIARWKRTAIESTAEFLPESSEQAPKETVSKPSKRPQETVYGDLPKHAEKDNGKIEVKVKDWVQGKKPPKVKKGLSAYKTDYDL